MKLLRWVLAVGCSVAAIHAQSCPALNFLQGASVTTYDSSYIGGLYRQPDGSFTRYRYEVQYPFNLIDSAANYQTAFLCSGAGARTFKAPAGWVPLAAQPGETSQTGVFSDFVGDGNVAGLAVVPAGFEGLAVDSLAITLFTPGGGHKPIAYYPVPPNPAGLLVADLNNDGKQDVVVLSGGTSTAPAAVAVFLGKGDGTVTPGATYATTGYGPYAAVAFDFNGDNKLDLAVLTEGNIAIFLGHGDGTFAAPVNYPVSQLDMTLALGDFNGDGHADLVAAGNQNFSMLLGNGDGTFRTAVSLPQHLSAYSMAAGDFNNDGKLDLAVSDAQSGTVSILLGDGKGGFASEYDYIAGYLPGNILATDLDGDGNLDVVLGSGHPDVLAANPYSDSITVFFGRGDGTLIGPPAYSVYAGIQASYPTSMALADFNGDGKPDLAVAAGDVWIMLSQGGGSFKTPVAIAIPSAKAVSVAAGDFNGDGKQDLVIGDSYGSGVYVLLGNGDGTFQPPVQYPMGGSITSVAVADFNGDGKLDIAACGMGAAGVLLGNGDGTFQSATSLTGFGSWPYWLTVGDFNKDGKPDLAIANQGTPGVGTDIGGVLVYLGKGDGTFQSPVSYPGGRYPNFIVAADVNGDKVPDLMVTATNPNFTTNFEFDIGVLLGKGDGTFGATSLLLTDTAPAYISVADINGDGKQDLAIAHHGGSTYVSFMFGNGDGTFQPEVDFMATSNPSAVLATDLNGDGKPDLVVGLDATINYVSVFLNISGQLNNLNGASFVQGPLAPNSFVSAFGTSLATVTQSSGSPYPTNVEGTTVTVTDALGVARLAPLSYVSPTQVNYIVPGSTALGQATVTVASGGTTSSAAAVIAAIDPGLFLFGGTDLVAAYVQRGNADGSQTVENIYTLNASGGIVPAPIDLSPANSQVYLVLYGTGLRGHSAASNSVTITAGGISLPAPAYAGAQPQYAGLDQIDVLLPQSLAGKGDVVIQVTVDGQAANPGHVTIQ
ncbi:MAG: FG-GAP-like repeat-containing protein [Bryobacteraceae bacterium]